MLGGRDNGGHLRDSPAVFELLPEEFLWAEDPKSKNRVRVPTGELRQRDVMVG